MVVLMGSGLPATFDMKLSTGRAAYRSWSSMKTWVMAWLWYLNIAYWVAILFLPRPEAFWALVSYVSIGPFIALMIISQRGLTRLSGLIHVPWIPFTAYLALRLFTDALGSRIGLVQYPLYFFWLQIVFWSTLVCVSLDVIDVIRWFAGERYVLGTPAAAAAGASKLARTD